MTAEEHLRQDVGGLVAQLLMQIALLKADNDRLKAALETATVPHRDAHVGPVGS